jgi:hypothetical protein
MKNLKMNVAFLYGDYDWVERAPADDLILKGEVKGEVFTV